MLASRQGVLWILIGIAPLVTFALDPGTAAADGAADERVQVAPSPQALGNFRLTDHESRPFGRDDLRDRTSLVFFGFTSCRSVCPPTLAKLRQVSRALGDDAGAVANILVSVDGDRDTPAVLKDFLQPFMPNFIGLTGTPSDVSAMASDFSAVFFKGMPTDTQGGYDVEHTSQVYLVDRNARLRATFYNAPVDAMVALVRQVSKEK